MKRLIQISFFVVSVVGLLFLTGFMIKSNSAKKVGDVEINIYRNTENGFINKTEIMSVINGIDSIKNLELENIQTQIIEKDIANNPYVDMIDCYTTIDGNLIVNIKEKQPIIRIYESGNAGYYIDNKGDIFPVCKQYSPRVIIANGYINDGINKMADNINDSIYKKSIAKELYTLTQLIKKNNLLEAQINQIYVNSKGEYDLIPELGNHLIKFGTINDAESKVNNLAAYYTRYLKTSNWDSYKTINLTYKDQIVCTKK